ncbi:right handed beta helix region domain-containing protein [Phthorimaea operculella]|nr:right handed beta helix region domain-containing protein [Phthorimaea operculella]
MTWTLYEKGLIRKQYLAKENAKCNKQKTRRNVVALWQGGTPSEFSHISNQLTDHLSPDHHLTITPSADDALTLAPERLVICSQEYEIPEMPLANVTISSIGGATLRSSDMRSCLLNLHSTCSLHSLKLQCSRVNTAIVIRGGALHVDNCVLCDDDQSEQSDFVQGIVAMSDSKLLIENTTFENFYSGIVVHKGARVELRNCKIRNCGVGIQMYSGAAVSLSNTAITNCAEHCIRAEVTHQEHTNNVEGLHIEPNCTLGSGDLQKEVLIVKQDTDLY